MLAPLAPLIAAAIVGTDRTIIAHLRSAGAVTPERAAPLKLRRPLAGWRTRRLVAAGALGNPSPDRYFLVEEGWRGYGRIRRRRALTVVLTAAALFAIYFVSRRLF
jgi:hypothetical protein